jgi:hypothetical protein
VHLSEREELGPGEGLENLRIAALRELERPAAVPHRADLCALIAKGRAQPKIE